MNIENQVSSVTLSNRLHELGVHQPSRFYREWTGAAEHEIDEWTDPEGDCCLDNVNCYTVAELGEMLGFNASSQLNWYEGSRRWVCSFNHIHQWAETEADARAKMLIYLIENGLVKP